MSHRSRERLLASPAELENYYELQDEIRNILRRYYRNYVDNIYYIGPFVLGPVGDFLRYYGLKNFDLFADLFHSYFGPYLTAMILIYVEPQIIRLLKLELPFQEWPSAFTRYELKLIFQRVFHFGQTCIEGGLPVLSSDQQQNVTTIVGGGNRTLIEGANNLCEYAKALALACESAILEYSGAKDTAPALAQKIFPHYKIFYEELKKFGFSFAEKKLSLELIHLFVCIIFSKLSDLLLLNHDPFGFYKWTQTERELMNEKPRLIRCDKLQNKTETLQHIKNYLESDEANPGSFVVWMPKLLFIGFCAFLILDWIFLGGVSENSVIILLSIFTTLLQKGSNLFITMRSSKRELSAQANNLKLLRNLCIALKLPLLSYQGDREGKVKYYLLNLNDSTRLGDIFVSRKIMMNALIRAFDKIKIRNYVHTSSQILLHSSVILSIDAIEGIISSVKQYITESINQENLNAQLKAISKITYGSEYKYYYPVTSDTSYATDYLFVIKDGFLDALKPNFAKMYGENNVKMVTHNNNVMLKVFAGARCEDKIFNATLMNIRKPSVSNRPQIDVTFVETSETKTKKFPHHKEKITTDVAVRSPVAKPEMARTPARIQKLNFGSFGIFQSNQENFPQPIEAPFYPPNTHFAFFRAPLEAFATTEQRDKFKNIRLHVVNGKGMKGLVAVGNYFFNTKEGLKKASFKLKDPSEDMRIYDYTLSGRNSDGKEIYLHIFEHVVAKAHK